MTTKQKIDKRIQFLGQSIAQLQLANAMDETTRLKHYGTKGVTVIIDYSAAAIEELIELLKEQQNRDDLQAGASALASEDSTRGDINAT